MKTAPVITAFVAVSVMALVSLEARAAAAQPAGLHGFAAAERTLSVSSSGSG